LSGFYEQVAQKKTGLGRRPRLWRPELQQPATPQKGLIAENVFFFPSVFFPPPLVVLLDFF
jgi:hypothetical protein